MALWKPLLLAVIAASAISGAQAGDLGRADPSIFEGILPPQYYSGPVTGYSSFPLTDDEIELRDRAYVLIRPHQPRGEWNLVVARFRLAQLLPSRSFDVTQYGRMLLAIPHRSEASLYAQLVEDTRVDVQLAAAFLALACIVADIDRKRNLSLAYIHNLTPAEYADTLGRILENKLTIKWVARSLGDRAQAYQYALERLVIASPSPRAVEAEQVVTRFQAASAEIAASLVSCVHPAIAVRPFSGPGRPLVTK
jgi:hypothetical protein